MHPFAHFNDELIASPENDGRHWILKKRFQYQSSNFGKITCPKGMVTDFASIPPLNLIGVFFALVSTIFFPSVISLIGLILSLFVISISHLLRPTGSYTRAATIHDFLYSDRTRCRSDCDGILYEAMLVCGTIWWKRWLIWFNVRIFGWACWHGRRWTAYRKN